MGYIDQIKQPGPKKLLALDGGGIRGVLSLEVLARIERLIQDQAGDETLTLGDYFAVAGDVAEQHLSGFLPDRAVSTS